MNYEPGEGAIPLAGAPITYRDDLENAGLGHLRGLIEAAVLALRSGSDPGRKWFRHCREFDSLTDRGREEWCLASEHGEVERVRIRVDWAGGRSMDVRACISRSGFKL